MHIALRSFALLEITEVVVVAYAGNSKLAP